MQNHIIIFIISGRSCQHRGHRSNTADHWGGLVLHHARENALSLSAVHFHLVSSMERSSPLKQFHFQRILFSSTRKAVQYWPMWLFILIREREFRVLSGKRENWISCGICFFLISFFKRVEMPNGLLVPNDAPSVLFGYHLRIDDKDEDSLLKSLNAQKLTCSMASVYRTCCSANISYDHTEYLLRGQHLLNVYYWVNQRS